MVIAINIWVLSHGVRELKLLRYFCLTKDRTDTKPTAGMRLQVGGSSGVICREGLVAARERLFIVFHCKVIYSAAFKAVFERVPSACCRSNEVSVTW